MINIELKPRITQTKSSSDPSLNTVGNKSEKDETIFHPNQNPLSSISDWLDDKDKICTDGKDDGKLTFKEAATSFTKGLFGLVKSFVKHPVATGLAVAGGVALTVATGGAILPALVTAGVALGAGQIGYGTYKAITADTDGEAKRAFETIGNGTFALASSALSAKTALKGASNAGVSAADGADDLTAAQATLRCIKATPEALSQSALNVRDNFVTLTTGVLRANSNALRGRVGYMSKPNEVQAYRFNPNGTPEEVLANNPGVFMNDKGQYCVANKWAPDQPYIIDTGHEQMIMMYGGDDMAVCNGDVFANSYVDTASFKSTGALNYQNPSELEYGSIGSFTKQAFGSFKSVSEDSIVQTLEGQRIVAQDDVAFDTLGFPYVTCPANIIKRNIPLNNPESIAAFEALKAKLNCI